MTFHHPSTEKSHTSRYSAPTTEGNLLHLFFKPTQYFSHFRQLQGSFIILIAIFVVGIAAAMDRVNQIITALGLLNTIPEINEKYLLFNNGWSHYWINVLIGSIFSAALAWYAGGWWYEVRLRYCDAKEVDLDDARRLYTMQEFVSSAPFVLMGVFHFFMYSNYVQAAQSKEMWAGIALFFVIWSCWTSYAAVITAYQLSKMKALLFFFILPVVIYILLFVLQYQ